MTVSPASKGRGRAYHKAALLNDDGDASALCYKRPRPIDLSKASWTLRDEAVTCRRCLAVMRRPPQSPVTVAEINEAARRTGRRKEER